MSGVGQRLLQSLAGLVDDFDVFFIDQFGILHDGAHPYPGAIEALECLKAANKRIVLISNSGKRAAVNIARLGKMGFDRRSYDHFLTSGEVAWQSLSTSMIGQSIPNQPRCFFISRDDDTSAIDGLDIVLVDEPGQADVILLTGCRDDVLSIAEYESLLASAATRGVRCICTNPDKFMLIDDTLKFAPGAIAERYAELGGPVTFIGKPYAEIYTAALNATQNPDKTRVLCIGDSVEHDIAGGSRAGLKTALVRSGIATRLTPSELDQLYADHDALPDYVLPRFAFT